MRLGTRAILPLMLLSTSVFAGPLPAPAIQPGQFVYTIPDGMDPPGIGRSGLDQINQVAKTLKYPFYVVIAQTLPGGSDSDAARAIDGLAESWSMQSGYDTGTSSIFLLTFSPRKWRFLAGARWKSELGFTNDAHRPYTDNFVRAVKGTPKDPKGGIIRTMQAVDGFLWEMTDPVKVAARQKAAAEQAERKRMDSARAAIGSQVQRLADLLKSDYAPKDTKSYEDVLKEGIAASKTDDPNKMNAAAAWLAPQVDKLASVVALSESEHQKHMLGKIAEWIFFLVVFTVVLVFSLRRNNRFASLKAAFDKEAKKWSEMVDNASNQYASVYLNRDDLVGMDKVIGKTKELYDSVTAEVNDILLCIKGLETHIAKCKEIAAKATFLSYECLIEAKDALEGDFEFDTEQVNKDDLFGKETKVIKVNATKFAAEQAARFKKCQANWERLKKAAEIRTEPAESLVSDVGLKMTLLKSPANLHRWLGNHPFINISAMYVELNALRMKDPVAVEGYVDNYKAKAVSVEKSFGELSSALDTMTATKNQKLPDLGKTTLKPEDDPQETLKQAFAAESTAIGLIASARIDDVKLVIAAIVSATNLYNKATQQSNEVASAINQAANAIALAKKQGGGATAISFANQTLLEAEKVHAKDATNPLRDSLKHAEDKLKHGNDSLAAAEKALAESRHLEAYRLAGTAGSSIQTATEDAIMVKSGCATLDQKKKEYERKAAEAKDRYERSQAEYRRYGGNKPFPAYAPPSINISNSSNSSSSNNGISQQLNYDLMLTQMVMQETMWQSQINSARAAQEAAAEAAREAAREAERQAIRRAQEAEESRRSSYSSSSSSSGSSYDSGSSSSGGGWDGGGSSSSGSDW